MLGIPAARAQGSWPERNITIVVCFPPGGSTDVSARIIGPGIAEQLGKPVVIEIGPAPAATSASATSPAPPPMATPCWLPAASSW
ncbi:hypothetical protein ACFQU2_05175 [Siccirubricoccus deserti]